jgi:hypothetical protein
LIELTHGIAMKSDDADDVVVVSLLLEERLYYDN